MQVSVAVMSLVIELQSIIISRHDPSHSLNPIFCIHYTGSL